MKPIIHQPLSCESLASALCNRLQFAGWSQVGSSVGVVSGVIEVPSSASHLDKAITVPIRVIFTDLWFGIIPQVYLSERPIWLKTGAEWHVFDTGWVCFELPEHWHDHVLELVRLDHNNVHELAAQWIIRATAHILHVHYVCHQSGRKFWPETIPFWGHGEEGRKQYKEGKILEVIVRKNV